MNTISYVIKYIDMTTHIKKRYSKTAVLDIVVDIVGERMKCGGEWWGKFFLRFKITAINKAFNTV
jgi:hypothetical protein